MKNETDKTLEAIGCMYAYACDLTATDIDIRHISFSEILDRMSKELDYNFSKPEEPKLKEVVMYQTLFKYKDGVVAGEDLYENISEALEARLPSLETVGYKPVTVYLEEE